MPCAARRSQRARAPGGLCPPRCATLSRRRTSRRSRRRSQASRRPAMRCSRSRSTGCAVRRRTGAPPCCSRSCGQTRHARRAWGTRRGSRSAGCRHRARTGRRRRSCAHVRHGTPAAPTQAQVREPAVAARGRLRTESALLFAATVLGTVVVVNEYLLERGLTAGQRGDRMLGERRDQRADAA